MSKGEAKGYESSAWVNLPFGAVIIGTPSNVISEPTRLQK